MTCRPLVLLLLLAVGCAEPVTSPRGAPTTAPATSASAPAAVAGRDPAQRYEVTAMVLQAEGERPQLCAGAVRDSLPPQCEGPDIVPFDWAAVPGETSASGVTWGTYRLVGTFDGSVFRPTESPALPVPPTPSPGNDFPIRCPEPPGGWAAMPRASEGADAAVHAYAQAQPDHAGTWLGWPDGDDPSVPDETRTVLNVAFTGDLDRHRREIAKRSAGAVCVTSLPRPLRELTRIQDDLFGDRSGAGAAGVTLLSGGVDEVGNVVRVEVLLADDVARRWVEGRYGAGVVVLTGALRPV